MRYEDKFYSSKESLSFDDVLIIPTAISYNESRLSTDLTTNLSRNYKLKIPFLASPMDRVTNFKVATILAELGAASCFHRFQSIESQLEETECLKQYLTEDGSSPIVINAISAQIKDSYELMRIKTLADDTNIFIIDTAMGTNKRVLDAIKLIKDKYPHIDLIAGNVVTEEGCHTLIEAGVDGIRAGIGNGSGCLTRIQTGVGRGQLTTLMDCYKVCNAAGVSLISDGGHSKPGDANKAIAAGADIVMMGSPLSGHNESPGEVYYLYKGHYFQEDDLIFVEGLGQRRAKDIEGLLRFKQYRGMASKEAQEDWKGLKAGTTHEGVQKYLKIKGSLEATIKNYIGGLRSSLTYVDATNLEEFKLKAKFEKLSSGSQKESYDR